jgi:hypothetical protein
VPAGDGALGAMEVWEDAQPRAPPGDHEDQEVAVGGARTLAVRLWVSGSSAGVGERLVTWPGPSGNRRGWPLGWVPGGSVLVGVVPGRLWVTSRPARRSRTTPPTISIVARAAVRPGGTGSYLLGRPWVRGEVELAFGRSCAWSWSWSP